MKWPNVTVRLWLGLPVAMSAGIEPGTTRADVVVADGAPAWPIPADAAVAPPPRPRSPCPSGRGSRRPGRRRRATSPHPARSRCAQRSPRTRAMAPRPLRSCSASTAPVLHRRAPRGVSKPSGDHTYKVCAAASFTSLCDQVTVRFSAGAAISRAARPARDSRAHGGRRHHRRIWMTHRGKK
jgi:hypothetical protein